MHNIDSNKSDDLSKNEDVAIQILKIWKGNTFLMFSNRYEQCSGS